MFGKLFALLLLCAFVGECEGQSLTVSYAISFRVKGKDAGIGETYNGGTQTLYASGERARLRLVSLMRVQSVYVRLEEGHIGQVVLLKESGKTAQRTVLTPEGWKNYNVKYEGLRCQLTDEVDTVLSRVCKKAVVTLKDGRVLTAYYSPLLHNALYPLLEPAFASVPGLVLRYEYTYKHKTIVYTATSISDRPIAAKVFSQG